MGGIMGMTLSAACTPRYIGKERDAESGNDYFGARYYSSNKGRFMSPDWSDSRVLVPFADLNYPQSLNLYAYVGNNPVTGVDPDGHVDPIPDDKKDCDKASADCHHTIHVGPQPTVEVEASSLSDSIFNIISMPFSQRTAPSKAGCNTVLPNGNTLSQYINQERASMQASVNAGGAFNGEVLAPFASIARDYGQIDFKNGAAGNSVLASRAVLGQAGNFSYYAIGSGYLSPSLLDTGAGAYAITSVLLGKNPFSTLTGPMFSDVSAASVRNAGLATPGCSQ
jgi:RHS repeat-associated protein